MKTGEKWALTWCEAEGFQMVQPDSVGPHDNAPSQARFLAAVGKLSDDPDFVKDVMDWFYQNFDEWKKQKKMQN